MRSHIITFLVLSFTIFLFCAASSAQVPTLFKDTDRKGDVQAKEDPTVIRSRNIEVNVALLEGGARKTVGVSFFDKKQVRITLERSKTQLPVQRRPALLLNGMIDGDVGSRAIFAVVGKTVSADITTGDGRIFQIRYIGNGVHSLRQIDQSKFPNEAEPLVPDNKYKKGQGDLPAADTCATDPPDSIDVMVVYTDDTRVAAGGTDAMTGTVYIAVEEANQSYINSNINQRLRLVHVEEVNYAESGNINTDLSRLQNGSDGFVDNVPTLRDTFAADVVSMITENGGGFCGLGYYMTTVSNAFESTAYTVVARSCATGYYSFAHELGHNMGANHDTANASGGGAYPYNHGFVHPNATAAQSWRTIMSYNTSPSSTRVQYWSNPGVNYPVGSVAMGTAASEDNHRVLNNTAPTVANFRCSSPGVANVWMKDTWSDTGAEPNPSTDPMWQSPYIWVRNSQDTGLTHQHEHQNPELGSTNWVYVKLHNGAATTQSGSLQLYYAFASTGLSWPSNWTLLTSIPVSGFAAHSTRIAEAQWNNLPGTGHYCMIARWVSTTDPMAAAETTDINANTKKNNNIVWRNLNIVDLLPDKAPDATFIFRNTSKEKANLALAINVPESEGKNSFFNFGQIVVTFDEKLFELVRRGLGKQPGVKQDGYSFIISNPRGVTFQNIAAPPGYEGKVTLSFRLGKNAPQRMYEVAATQYQQPGTTRTVQLQPQVIGGVSYQIYNYKHE